MSLRHHEDKYGMATSYNEEAYTTKLPSAVNTPDYHQKRADAERAASEIEACQMSRNHQALEDSEEQNEESKYSAVIRPGTASPLQQK